MSEALKRLSQSFFSAFKPPPKLSLSEWADSHAVLSAESSAESGRWKTIPYQKGIMDAVTDPRIEQIYVMKSARVGYTKIINHTIGYHVHQDPCSIMVVQPTLEDASGYSKEEVAPMLRDTPALAGLVSDAKAKDSSNTILQKQFPGGTLGIVGANSARGFRRVSRRVVIFDEVDGYPASAGTEGDPVKLGIRRTEYYWNRKIIGGSTPTVKDFSRIERLFNSGDRRRYFVPCPHCDHFQFLKWKNLKWAEGNPRDAFFVCELNGCVIEHKDKRRMVEKGEWRPTSYDDEKKEWIEAPQSKSKIVSFHIWAAYSYSPNASWGDLAEEFLEAKKNVETLQTFINTALGEVWESDYSKKIDASDLRNRVEQFRFNHAPERVLLVTAGVDIQDNRIAITKTGWGNLEESWTIFYQEIYGDPSLPDVWLQLENVLLESIEHEKFGKIGITAAAIDSGGHFTHEVYQFCRQFKSRHWLAIKGSSQRARPAISKPKKVDINMHGLSMKSGVNLYSLGVDTIKSTLMARLKHAKPGPGFVHFSHELMDEFFDQLTAEKEVMRYVKGHPIKEWVKRPGQRNEALDCFVYSYAALQFWISRYNRSTFWAQMEKNIANKVELAPDNKKEEPTKAKEPISNPLAMRAGKKGGFVGKW